MPTTYLNVSTVGLSTTSRRAISKRAFQKCCQPVSSCVPVAIDLAVIATDSGESTYTLTGNVTITECQILTIPYGTSLSIGSGSSLTNRGTINNNGYISTVDNLFNTGTINNNGTIENNVT
jgi:hypothetical protein